MHGLLKRVLLVLLSLGALGLMALPGEACPFCTMQGQTFTGEVAQASMVLFGEPTNVDEVKETTDLKIETIVKDHKDRKGRTVLKLSRAIPPTFDGVKYKYLVFFDIFEGKMDPYRGVAIKTDSKLPEYLKGALQHKDQAVGKRMRFFFDHLDSDDTEVSNDAYKEFANADYKDYKGMATTLPANKVTGWLRDSNTPAFRLGLYASMLGHCGKEKDAAVLKALLDDPDRRAGSGVDGMFAAYVMLQPKQGWKYTTDVLKDGKHEFMFRYAALRSVRFLYEFRSDLVSKKDLIEGVSLLLDHDDIADMAVEDLRKWERWEKVERVLALQKSPAFRQAVVRRAVLRYCLSCKGSPAATAYVAQQRMLDPQAVLDAEELLKLDEAPVATPPATPKR